MEAALDEARGHLVGLSGCRNGAVPRHLLAGEREAALAAAREWARHFPDGDFAVELSHHLGPTTTGSSRSWPSSPTSSACRRSSPTRCTTPIGTAIGCRTSSSASATARRSTEARELLLPNAEYRLKPGRELAVIGAGLPDERSRRAWEAGMARSAAIGAECRLELGFERYRFPGFSVPEGETAFSYLYQLAHAGLLRRYQPVTKRALSQLAHELDVIDRTNLSEFFLIVWDLMEFARTNDIIGQGRGSAGDSIVAYCLGITKVDPIEHKLLFERFINEARALPDIDIDFDVNRREEVIQYLYTKYGADHAAMVCTIVTYRARSAVREVAKALGFPLEGIDALAKALDTRDATDVARDLALDGSFGWLFDELGTRHGRCGRPARSRRPWHGHRAPPGRFVVEPATAAGDRPQAAADQPRLAGRPGRSRRCSTRNPARSARAAGTRRSGRVCSTHRSRRSGTSRRRRSATPAPASWPARSSRCRRRATTARPGRRAGRPKLVRIDPESRHADRGASPAAGRAGRSPPTILYRYSPSDRYAGNPTLGDGRDRL